MNKRIDKIVNDNLNKIILNTDISRNKFLKIVGATANTLLLSQKLNASELFKDDKHIFVDKEAKYYNKLPHEKVECILCPRKCIVDSDERGYCGVRENKDGKYYKLV